MALSLVVILLLAAGAARAIPPEWSTVYTAYPQAAGFAPYIAEAFTCSGPYALCSAAECKITSVARSSKEVSIAECGCYGFKSPSGNAALNLGATAGMLDQTLKTATAKACPATSRTCANTTNLAPACAAQNASPPKLYGRIFDFISAFNPATWPYQNTPNATYCTNGTYTNCYAAG